MEIIFIGTGSGKTSLHRDHSSIALKNDGGEILLIDAGDGTGKALMKNKIEYEKIAFIILTHYHPDHYTGIAALLTQMKLINRKSSLNIFTHKNLVEPLKQFLNSCYLFKDVFDFEVYISQFEFGQKYRVNNEISFSPIQNSHVQNKYKVNYPSHQFISSSLYIETEAKKILYTSDIGSEKDFQKFTYLNPDILISETTHVPLESISTFSIDHNIDRVYLTHIDDEMEEKISRWEKLQNQNSPHKFTLAFDGFKVSI